MSNAERVAEAVIEDIEERTRELSVFGYFSVLDLVAAHIAAVVEDGREEKIGAAK